LSKAELTNRDNLIFWQKRMDNIPENFSNGPKYASALASRFRLYGDIQDLLKADSLIKESNIANQEKEGDIFLSMAGFAIQQHHFNQAALVDKAKNKRQQVWHYSIQFDVALNRFVQWALTTLNS
jgi:hypothetical protein